MHIDGVNHVVYIYFDREKAYYQISYQDSRYEMNIEY